MNEAALEIVAGVNATVVWVSAALRLVLSGAAAIILDPPTGQNINISFSSLPSAHQIQGMWGGSCGCGGVVHPQLGSLQLTLTFI